MAKRDLIDLDLSIPAGASETVRVKGASGRVFEIELWIPLAAVIKYAMEYDRMSKDAMKDGAPNTDILLTAFQSGYEIASTFLAKDYPDLTLADIQTEFPNESILRLVGFLFRRYMSGLAPEQPSPPQVAASDSAATRKPTPTSKRPLAPRQRASTGSR